MRRTAVVALVAAAALSAAARTPQPGLEARLLEIYGADSGEIRYFPSAVDLDGDGKDEFVVHVAGPVVCGTGGCETLVFTPEGGGLRLVAEIGLTRPPVVAAATRTNGWRDLVVAVGGGGAAAHNARLRFDGRTYPDNPTIAPAQRVRGRVQGTLLIKPYEFFTEGKLLRAGSE